MPVSFGSPVSGTHVHAEHTAEPFKSSNRLHHGSHVSEWTPSSHGWLSSSAALAAFFSFFSLFKRRIDGLTREACRRMRWRL